MSHRQVSEPVVVGVDVEPVTAGRLCCANCVHKGGRRFDRGNDWIQCNKHGRVTFPAWWCSDHLSEAEAEMRAEALAAVEGKPLMSLRDYFEARREVSETG